MCDAGLETRDLSRRKTVLYPEEVAVRVTIFLASDVDIKIGFTVDAEIGEVTESSMTEVICSKGGVTGFSLAVIICEIGLVKEVLGSSSATDEGTGLAKEVLGKSVATDEATEPSNSPTAFSVSSADIVLSSGSGGVSERGKYTLSIPNAFSTSTGSFFFGKIFNAKGIAGFASLTGSSGGGGGGVILGNGLLILNVLMREPSSLGGNKSTSAIDLGSVVNFFLLVAPGGLPTPLLSGLVFADFDI